VQTFNSLPRHRCDQLEVLVHVQHGQPCQLRGGRDEQVRNRGGSVVILVTQEQLDFGRTIFDRWVG
jgi:hypothetical protein